MKTNTRLFVGFKCMLDCVYWWKKSQVSDYDFDIGQGYAGLTDERIYRNWDRLAAYIHGSPVVLMNDKEEFMEYIYPKVIQQNAAFNNHNGIMSCKFDDGDYTFVSMPCDSSTGEVYAVMLRPGTKAASTGPCCNTYRLIYRCDGVIVKDFSESPFYNFATNNIVSYEVDRYLSGEYIVGSPLNKSIGVPDLVCNGNKVILPESVNEKTGRYDYLYAICDGGESVQDNYEKLVSALSLINEELPSEVNYILASEDDEEKRKKVEVLKGVKNGTMTISPFGEAVRRMIE